MVHAGDELSARTRILLRDCAARSGSSLSLVPGVNHSLGRPHSADLTRSAYSHLIRKLPIPVDFIHAGFFSLELPLHRLAPGVDLDVGEIVGGLAGGVSVLVLDRFGL